MRRQESGQTEEGVENRGAVAETGIQTEGEDFDNTASNTVRK